jgi:hypothetical protein
VAVAEELFHNEIDTARRQGVLALKLRTAIRMAQMRNERGDADAPHASSAPVYGRFIEGFETADMRSAKVLIDILAPAEAENAHLHRTVSCIISYVAH